MIRAGKKAFVGVCLTVVFCSKQIEKRGLENEDGLLFLQAGFTGRYIGFF